MCASSAYPTLENQGFSIVLDNGGRYPVTRETPSWVAEVASPAAFKPILNAQTGPRVMVAPLHFSEAAQEGLSRLSYHMYAPGNKYNIPELDSATGSQQAIMRFRVAGWHKNPADSHLAKQRFCELAKRFFPIKNAQAIATDLAEQQAQLASGLDLCTLSMQFRVMRNQNRARVAHIDTRGKTVAISYLLGDRTTAHLAPSNYSVRDYDTANATELTIPVAMTDKTLQNLYASNTHTMQIWRAGDLQAPSAHVEPDRNALHIILMTVVPSTAFSRPAHRQLPNLWTNLRDRRETRYLQYAD